ncbi:amino acid adenylation domain-containing protein [Streptomyces sp. NA04227]|uniref:non-ribosomal peptide synthetase n=1 Tax=Streptomyces sp. NA04227 TaxID=2742136 RepID=UPI00158FF182|nr:non-ribosomal peptide synthetase [Streptomyces sp. NA04227]QKW08919.1 amino acid adenylation domain-containing protein [Streptomyces sp. NA04227]
MTSIPCDSFRDSSGAVPASGELGGVTVSGLFGAQVARTPDAVALVEGDRRWTYRELDAAVGVVAARLGAVGVGPGRVVGVCSGVQSEMVVGLLGVLRAGAAYVPLDLSYPVERLAFMLEDSGAEVMVVGADVPAAVAGRGVVVDVPRGEIPVGEVGVGGVRGEVAGPDDLAYVIYTSGSTGKPKGVEVTHTNLASMLRELRPCLGSEVLLLASLTFDASWRAVGILLTGGCLHVLDNRRDLPAASRYLNKHGVDTVSCTPSQLAALLAAGPLPTPLRIMAGGEPFPADMWRRLSDTPDVVAFNLYGPTECTVDATLARVEGDRPVIGRPLNNVRLYVLDVDGALAPVGVPGELYIGGLGVARGYRNRPGLTAERFVPDPWGAPGERLYRSGDLVRYRSSGEVEFLGRIDDQVKIRGYRVEPGEVESVLRRQAVVEQAVVVAHGRESEDRRLIAYVTVASGHEVERGVLGSRLREDLAGFLPDFMVPSTVMVLDAMPVGPGGKLDRQALPEPDGSRPELAARFEAPRTRTEEVVAEIWSELLGVSPIGLHDDFFELGGHSMLAIQVIARINDTLDTDVNLRVIFESPTVAALSKHLDGLITDSSRAALQPVPRTGRMPLSHAQQRLWFLDQLVENNPFYNVPDAVRMRGPLDLDALAKALSAVVARHEVLRATIHEEAGHSWQEFAHPAPMTLPLVDVSGEADPESAARRLVREEARTPFDLSAGPLLRADVVRLGPDDHVLRVTMHHVVADAWSRLVLMRELSLFYAAFVEGKDAALPALSVQYADFAVWQRRCLEESGPASQVDYWRGALAGAPPLLQLPTDRPRPVVPSYRGAAWDFAVPAEVCRQLRRLGQAHGATLFMVGLAAFQAVLGRFAATRDVVVGVPIAGRHRPELESLIGFFVNTLAMRTDCSGDPRFEDLLGRTRDTALGAYEHQDLPFEQLVEELAPVRDLGRNPIVQVMFQLNDVPQPELDLPSLRVDSFAPLDEVTRFDLSMFLAESGEGLEGQVVYAAELFDESTVARLAEGFVRALEAVATDASVRLSQLPVLGEAERDRLLSEWNVPASGELGGVTVSGLFGAQVARTPDAVALVEGDRRWTYRELDAAVGVVAARLGAVGVGPGRVVGVCSGVQSEMVVGLLGVLRAGAAYVPLDLSYPVERLAFMLEDSGAEVMVVGADVPAAVAGRGVVVDVPRGEVSPEEVAGADAGGVRGEVAGPDDLAYVIYTSGSTGQPKGVEVTHRALANLMTALRDELAGDRLLSPGLQGLLLSPLSFDSSVKQLLLMCEGVTLHVLNESTRKDPAAVAAYVCEQRIDEFNCTPTMLRALIDSGLFGREHTPRFSLIGGEAIDPELWLMLSALSARYGHSAFNLYGPTECTVDATLARVEGDRPVIGRPLNNVRLYVVDVDGALAPVGVPGELYIGGLGVARGYRNRPGLTAERFVPDPWGAPGERLYRSGDLVRYRSSGEVEFLGRIDDQVKIRGYRVEPGEVESVLRRQAVVEQAVVVAHGRESEDRRLIAYVTVASGHEVERGVLGSRLREDLAGFLPDFMVPSTVMVLDAMPVGPGGKLDRQALPEPDGSRPELAARFEAPRTRTEEVVAEIWSELLGVSPIGLHDDFFELGGHSMLAIQVIARINDTLDTDINLRVLFNTPSVAALAKHVRSASGGQGA